MKFTEKYRTLTVVSGLISFLLMFGPVIVFGVSGMAITNDKGKFILSIALITVLMLTLINAIFKFHFRSIIWIMLLAMYYALQNAEMLILVFGICQLLDELVVEPLHKMWKTKWAINVELDKRYK